MQIKVITFTNAMYKHLIVFRMNFISIRKKSPLKVIIHSQNKWIETNIENRAQKSRKKLLQKMLCHYNYINQLMHQIID